MISFGRLDEPNYLSVELEPKLQAGRYAREAIRGAFGQVPQRVMAKLLTVVGELVTNAVQHGPGLPIRLRVALDPKACLIRGEVLDQGDRLVDAMTSEWRVAEGSTSVQFDIPLQGG